jgi:hypothetical protein
VARWRNRLGGLAAAALVAGCAGPEARAPDADRPFRLRFEEAAAPGAFSLEASAVRDRDGGAAGLWAVVPGLPRPERALIVNLETGAETVVALFAGGAGPVRVSNEAADALGIGAGPAPVGVTALRSRPSIDTTRGRYNQR